MNSTAFSELYTESNNDLVNWHQRLPPRGKPKCIYYFTLTTASFRCTASGFQWREAIYDKATLELDVHCEEMWQTRSLHHRHLQPWIVRNSSATCWWDEDNFLHLKAVKDEFWMGGHLRNNSRIGKFLKSVCVVQASRWREARFPCVSACSSLQIARTLMNTAFISSLALHLDLVNWHHYSLGIFVSLNTF